MNEEQQGDLTGLISIEDFQLTDIRIACIVKAEKVPKADKLLRVILDIGESDTRQVVAGIALHYEPEALTGKLVLYLANLKPIKLRGVTSQGMLLAATDGKGNLALATVDKPMEKGSKIS